MTFDINVILHESTNTERNFAKNAAKDGVITYFLANHNETQKLWMERNIEFITNKLNLEFVETSSNLAEIIYTVDNISYEQWLVDGKSTISNGNGKFTWKSSANTRGYGGVQDQATCASVILHSLGLSDPENQSWNENYTPIDTILSENWQGKGRYALAINPTENDIKALQYLYGQKTSTEISSKIVVHSSKKKEDLLIGEIGQKDIFVITTKGMNIYGTRNHDGQPAIQYDDLGKLYRGYTNVSIGNFSLNDGDLILISRTLFSPYDPRETAKSFSWAKEEGQSTSLKFIHTLNGEEDRASWASSNNLLFNDAAKLLVNVDGTKLGTGPGEAWVNDHLIAFIDITETYRPEDINVSQESFGIADHNYQVNNGNYQVQINGTQNNDLLLGELGEGYGNDVFTGYSGNDTINGGSGYDTAIYRGTYSDYTITLNSDNITLKDNRNGSNDGTDTLSNINKLIFFDTNALVIKDEVKPINFLGFQSKKVYEGKSEDYKFYALGENQYGIETSNRIDALTGESVLQFEESSLNLATDIKSTFDQVTGLNTASGEMFRLYNAAFARFPDTDGLKYWIDQFSSGKNTRRVVAQSFLGSAEFTEKYGSNVSDETYVNNLYKNVLGRDADTEGLNYWVGNLSSGIETRYEALLGFAESAENKALFTEMTGFS